ncbi:MAG: sulfatase [Verrucomicrobiales bacterium]|nr:sulfatase [Verrucomicrobiales bacterium]
MKVLRIFLLLALVSQSLVANSKTKPLNFVFILVDDLGWADLNCFGSSFYDTPNCDQLAASGMKFTNAYAACPVCSPTRASIMTGRYPTRTGVTDYIGAAAGKAWRRNTRLLPAVYTRQLELKELTLAEVLRGQGYATFFAGKWHLGNEGFWPEDQGFDVNQGGIQRGGPYGGKKYFSPYGNPRLKDGPDGEHLPDRLASETVKFMERNKDQPFFAYLSFYSVHTPLISREDLKLKYLARKKKRGLEAKWGKEHNRKVRLVQEHAVYGGMIEAMDLAVGKVLDGLKRLKLAENTVVFFMSDNGGLSTSEGHPTSNLPLRGGKGWMYEGGIREPMMVRWPGVTKPGSVSASPVISTDFFPTILELAGIKHQPPARIDGVSFTTALRGTPHDRGAIYWHYPHYGNQGCAPTGAIREGDWKLIEWYEDGKLELFNLKKDIGEKSDLAKMHPDKVKTLATQLAKWRKDTGAKMPMPNKNFDPNKREGR